MLNGISSSLLPWQIYFCNNFGVLPWNKAVVPHPLIYPPSLATNGSFLICSQPMCAKTVAEDSHPLTTPQPCRHAHLHLACPQEDGWQESSVVSGNRAGSLR